MKRQYILPEMKVVHLRTMHPLLFISNLQGEETTEPMAPPLICDPTLDGLFEVNDPVVILPGD